MAVCGIKPLYDVDFPRSRSITVNKRGSRSTGLMFLFGEIVGSFEVIWLIYKIETIMVAIAWDCCMDIGVIQTVTVVFLRNCPLTA